MDLTWIEISKEALANNISEIRKNIPDKMKMAAVIKANAAGHGILEVAREVQDKVEYLAVFSFKEALLLRKNNFSNPILLLGRILPFQLQAAVDNDIEISVSTFDILESAKEIGGKNPKMHLCVETGLGRDGFVKEDFERVLDFLKVSDIDLRGIYTHFSSADEGKFDDYTKKQIDELLEFKKAVNNIGYNPIVHKGGSSSLFHRHREEEFGMIRVGINLYGLWTSPELKQKYRDQLELQPVLSWKARIVEVKNMPKGSAISYGCTNILQRDSKVAIVPIGYYDGIYRVTSNKGKFLVNGKKVNQLGRVTMNMVVLDVTDVEQVNVGDVATVIGKDGDEIVKVEDWAAFAGTSGYEIVTRLNSEIKRIVV